MATQGDETTVVETNHLEPLGKSFHHPNFDLEKEIFQISSSACFHSQCVWGSPTRPKPIPNAHHGVIQGPCWPCSGWCGQQGASASRGRIWGPGRRSAPGVQVRWNAPTRPGSPRWQVVAEKRLLIFLVSERVKDADWKIFFGG